MQPARDGTVQPWLTARPTQPSTTVPRKPQTALDDGSADPAVRHGSTTRQKQPWPTARPTQPSTTAHLQGKNNPGRRLNRPSRPPRPNHETRTTLDDGRRTRAVAGGGCGRGRTVSDGWGA
ncbi:hypothetical protein Acsp01_22100 [Actinoplanes sp. NBRC 101535]|nr:hypothetical protein Acsp01_22100 [Actinoplanes sp. NBRC 101535]